MKRSEPENETEQNGEAEASAKHRRLEAEVAESIQPTDGQNMVSLSSAQPLAALDQDAHGNRNVAKGDIKKEPGATDAHRAGTEENGEGQFAKQKHAMDFLYKVRVQYSNNPAVYNQFLEIMKDFKSGSIDTPEVITRVKALFRGNDFLIQEFNAFLPPGFKIEPDEPEQPGEEPGAAPPAQGLQFGQTGDKADLEHARNYVRKIKNRFALQPHIYKQFLEILHDYYQAQHSINDVFEEVAELFQNHQDLLEEFRHFLPKSVGEGNQAPIAPIAKKLPKRKKPEKQPAKRQTIPAHEEKRERERRDRTFFEEEEIMPPVIQRPKRERSAVPKKTFYNFPVEKEKYVPRRGLGNGLAVNKEFTFLNEVKKRLTSYLYQEFLKSVNLFSQDTISKREVLQLVYWLLGPNRDLYEKFKLFIAFDEEDPFPEYKVERSTEEHKESKSEAKEDKDDKDDGEDEEVDLVVEMNASTMRAFEELTTNADQSTVKSLLSTMDVIHLRNVERMYGDKGPEVIESLHANPLAVIPVILKRLRQRNQEWGNVPVDKIPQPQPEDLEEEERMENASL